MAQDGNSFILAQASSRPVVPLEGLGEGLTMREERSKAMLVKSPVCISMKRSSEPPEVMTTFEVVEENSRSAGANGTAGLRTVYLRRHRRRQRFQLRWTSGSDISQRQN